MLHKSLLAVTGLALITSCAKKEVPLSGSNFSTISVDYMDKTIQPEDDFFLFANGNWINTNEIPASESRWGSFNELDQENKKKLTSILEEAKANQGEKGSQNQLLGAYYASFIDMEKRNQRGLSGIQQELNRIDSMNRKDFIVQMIAANHKDGIGSAFSFGVGQDMKNVSMNAAYMGQGGLGLPNKDYYLSENKKDLLNAYKVHIAKSFILLGQGNEQAQKTSEEIIELEKKLAVAMMSPAEMRIPEKTYNKQSLKETMALMGTFDLRNYFNAVGCQTPDTIIVGNPKYLRNFAKVLESESLQAWKNYLKWTIVNHYAGNLNEQFVALNFDFYGTKLSGKKIQKPMNEKAIDEITNIEIGELLGKAFVEKHFSTAAQARVNEMVDNLLAVFRERIKELDWMSDATKSEALNKLSSIGRKLGFPDKWENYSSLNFSADNYLSNVKEMNRFSVRKNFDDLKKPVDKDKWGMPAHMVNAYYHPLLNEIAFPAGIMQAPFFDEKAEDAVNYGRIGMVIGHEFTHGFDDMGSKFAADGSFKNWWTEEDLALFAEKTKLLGETFAAFCPMEGQCVNPDLTMGENIADLGGLTMAFYAYKRTAEYKANEVREGYTPAQRFFISYAQLWKIKYTDEEMKNRIANDPHSPGMYRVNGPLKNCPEFFEAFDVKEGRVMRNEVKKVARIW
ncbi:MAG: M13 family metallopeptidase [Crocinitomicaceae bacterium]|nr:M13 family metallopeptidase [Crocinitomicaceae bacterium]MDP4760148.1 M13 family metallopeptidase [Crocinitomicaceae bacterium]